jgi:uncharacterized protein YdiU (UPF0061 family)
MFCKALQPLLTLHQSHLQELEEIKNGFAQVMQTQMENMWAAKLGLGTFDATLFNKLVTLMAQTPVDYILFFRELSMVPDDITPLKKSFYDKSTSEEMDKRWSEWFIKWKLLSGSSTNENTTAPHSREELSRQMKLVNPKFSLREWFVMPAYQQATEKNYSLVRELQDVITQPYAEQSKDVEEKYYRLKPSELFDIGGLSQYSCSS